jgi:hypothetical protein
MAVGRDQNEPLPFPFELHTAGGVGGVATVVVGEGSGVIVTVGSEFPEIVGSGVTVTGGEPFSGVGVGSVIGSTGGRSPAGAITGTC